MSLLGGRLMVRLQTLDLRIGVRVPASQPAPPSPLLLRRFRLARYFVGALSRLLRYFVSAFLHTLGGVFTGRLRSFFRIFADDLRAFSCFFGAFFYPFGRIFRARFDGVSGLIPGSL